MKGANYMAADKKEAASKQEALENALKKIEKDFGKGSIMRLGQGKENAKQSLRDQPAICEEIEAKIRAKLLENPEAGDSLKQAEAEAERANEGAPADDEA